MPVPPYGSRVVGLEDCRVVFAADDGLLVADYGLLVAEKFLDGPN